MFTNTKFIHTVAVITASAVFLLAALLTGGILLFPTDGDSGMQGGSGNHSGSGLDGELDEGDFWSDLLNPGGAGGNGGFWDDLLGDGSGVGGMLSGDMPNVNLTVARIYSDVSVSKIYLRRQSYGDLNGQTWNEAQSYHALIGDTHAATYLPSFAIEETGGEYPIYVEIDLEDGFDQYLIPYYTATWEADYPIQTDETKSAVGADHYSMHFYDYELGDGDRIPGNLSAYEKQYRRHVYDTYLSVDDETRKYLDEVIKTAGIEGSTGELVEAVADYVQHAAVYNMKYNTALDDEPNMVIAFLDQYKEGVCRHYAASATMMYRTLGIPARYTEGFLAGTVAGEWKDITALQAHAWVEVYFDGLGWIPVEVTGSASTSTPADKIPLTLYPITVEAQYDPYDPATLAPPTDMLKGFEAFAEKGYTLKADISGSLDVPGKIMSTLESVTIYDPDGNDVTDAFEVLRGTGYVHLYRDVIEYRGENDERVYDGTVLSADDTNCYHVSGTLERGHTATVVPLNGIIHVGSTSGRYRISVTDRYGADVTDEYKYVCRTGTVKITPATLTLTAGSATKPYDGTPLTYDGVPLYDPYELVKGDFIDYFVISGSQTEIGISETRIEEIRIMRTMDGELVDVTRNYVITLEKGTLKVTLPQQ